MSFCALCHDRIAPVYRTTALALILALPLLLAPAAATEPGRHRLPPQTVRGLAHLLDQYPSPQLATPTQRAASRRLLDAMRKSSRRWHDPDAAAEAGFATRRPYRKLGDTRVMWFHAEHRRWSHDGRYLDPKRPEVLIYADMPGRPLVLVGFMFSMPRSGRGPTPGGPITRWHWHRVCTKGAKRGLAPGPDGRCPSGATMRNGSEMMHMWLTRDLRSAFAIHAPVHDLCVAALLPADRCDHTQHSHG
jgi:hypothetical protein